MSETCPPLVNMNLLIELIPSKHPITIYRYNSAKGGKKRLPEPDLTVGSVSLWSLDTIQDWATRSKLELDPTVLSRICQSQVVGSEDEL